jgi:predicted transcriptional regulator
LTIRNNAEQMRNRTRVIRGKAMTDFEEIDKRRREAGLTRLAVYRRAGVNGETWRRLARGANEPNLRTLRKLSDALDALIREGSDGMA